MITTSKTCLSCQRHLHGRSDKKFCNDYCRNSYNNHLNSDENNFVRNINNHLRRNRKILEGLLPAAQNMRRFSRQLLLSKGFAFHYCTHIQTNKKGNTWHFCYEYGYASVKSDKIMLIRKKELKE